MSIVGIILGTEEVGRRLGAFEEIEGFNVGLAVGAADRKFVGENVGRSSIGKSVGNSEGYRDDISRGNSVGNSEGNSVGNTV